MVVRDTVLTYGVLHNTLRSKPITGNNAVALQKEQAVYVPIENYRNPLREAKLQRDLLKDYFNHMGALPGQENRI